MKEKTNAAKPAPETEEVKVAQPADAQPADAQPADAQPADAQPADAQPADAQPASLLQKELELRRTRSKSGLSALQVEIAKRKGVRVKGHLTVAQEALRRRRK